MASAQEGAREPVGRDARPLFFAVDLGEYLHHPRLDVETEVAGIAALLADFGFVARPWAAPMAKRGADAVAERLLEWSSADPAANTFVYWVGHGFAAGGNAGLVHALTPRRAYTGSIGVETVARYVRSRESLAPEEDPPWTIVVIDACRSRDFAALLDKELKPDFPRRTLLVGVSDEGVTHLGEFRRCLEEVLTQDFRAEELIKLGSLAEALRERLPERAFVASPQTKGMALRRVVSEPVAVPLDVLARLRKVLAGMSPDERRHFIPKAKGAGLGEASWFFQGRVADRHAILRWLRQRTGMLVVSGAPGAGKSALLGDLVMHTYPQMRKVLVEEGLIPPLPDSELPKRPFDLIMHVAGATAADVEQRISEAAAEAPRPRRPARPRWRGRRSRTEGEPDWLGELRRNGTRLRILVDALDEAQDPVAIAGRILRPLSRLRGMQVVVGTRRSTKEAVDRPSAEGDTDLLDALGANQADLVWLEPEPNAIRDYVQAALRAGLESDDRAELERRISAVSDMVAERKQEFLFARLAVYEIVARPELLEEGSRERLERLLSGSHRDLFAAAVRRLTDAHPANRHLLHALALGRGHGLPIHDRIWTTVAGVVAGGEEFGRADVSRLIRMAKPYIMNDLDHGQTVYRLAHATFAEHFRAEDQAAKGKSRQLQEAVTRALATVGEECVAGGELNPYLVHYLADHAREGAIAAWRILAGRTALLDHLDPASVVLASVGIWQFLPTEILAIIDAQHLLTQLAPADRWAVRALAMARLDAPGRSRRTREISAPHAKWSILWTDLRKHRAFMTLPTVGRVMTAFRDSAGHVRLAICGHHGYVEIWDPLTGQRIGAPMSTGDTWIRSMAAYVNGAGKVRLAIGDHQGHIQIWDPDHGRQLRVLTGHTDGVRQLVPFRTSAGEVRLASTQWMWHGLRGLSSVGSFARVWDPETGLRVCRIRRRDARKSDPARKDWKRPPKSLDRKTRELFRQVRRRDRARLRRGMDLYGVDIHLLNSTEHGTELIVSDYFGSLRVFDAMTGRHRMSWRPTVTSIHKTLKVVVHNGSERLALVDRQNRCLLWDPATRDAEETTADSVCRVDFDTLWSPATADDFTLPAEEWSERGMAVAAFTDSTGEAMLAICRTAPERVELRRPLSGRTQVRGDSAAYVTALHAFTAPDGRLLVALGGQDGSISVLDPLNGRRVGDWRHPRENERVVSLTSFSGPEGSVGFAAAFASGEVLVGDSVVALEAGMLKEGQPYGPAQLGLVAFEDEGAAVLAIVPSSGQVELWDPRARVLLRSVDLGHDIRLPLTTMRFPGAENRHGGRMSFDAQGRLVVWGITQADPLEGMTRRAEDVHISSAPVDATNDQGGVTWVYPNAQGRPLAATARIGGPSITIRGLGPDEHLTTLHLGVPITALEIAAGVLVVASSEGVVALRLDDPAIAPARTGNP